MAGNVDWVRARNKCYHFKGNPNPAVPLKDQPLYDVIRAHKMVIALAKVKFTLLSVGRAM
jgi:hypothetical protein